MPSRLVAEAGSIAGLATWQPADFQRLKGIGRVRGTQLVAILEIGRRMICPSHEEKPLLNHPELIANYMQPYAGGLEIERFWALCLNRKNRLIKRVEFTSGTATAALVSGVTQSVPVRDGVK